MEFEGFHDVVVANCHIPTLFTNPASELTAIFKSLRHGLRKWSRNLSQLNKIIESCSAHTWAYLQIFQAFRILKIQIFQAFQTHFCKKTVKR
jgi:hypothetical protein